jgi:hypothetical protein
MAKVPVGTEGAIAPAASTSVELLAIRWVGFCRNEQAPETLVMTMLSRCTVVPVVVVSLPTTATTFVVGTD